MALQHAGEDAGGYLVEGLINYLISEDPGAQEAREKFIFHIIPMMNPDGMVNGITRYNTAMEDLNNIWLNDERAQPEVTGVKNWVDRWYRARQHHRPFYRCTQPQPVPYLPCLSFFRITVLTAW
jgi:cytosolic carboxypeptidase protein 2/3